MTLTETLREQVLAASKVCPTCGQSTEAGGVRALAEKIEEKDLGPEKIAAVIKRVTDKEVTFRAGDDRRGMGVTLGAFITSSLTGDEMGAILTAIETGEVPPAVEAPAEMESAL